MVYVGMTIPTSHAKVEFPHTHSLQSVVNVQQTLSLEWSDLQIIPSTILFVFFWGEGC